MNWPMIWKLTFIGLVAVFAVMSVMVTVLGARDVRQLIERLRNRDS